MSIGETIRNFRKKNRMSSSSLAKKVGVPKHIISRWENGDLIPDSVELKKLFQALNISLDTFLNKTEYDNDADLLTSAYDDYHEKNKGKIIFLIIAFLIISFFIGDTVLAITLKRSPLISWKVEYLSGKSYVDKGLFMDTYYCFTEKNNYKQKQKIKFSGYECPSPKKDDKKTNKQVKNITDTSKSIKDFKCSAAKEMFYEDDEFTYYLECTNSSYVIVTYYNDKKENIKVALEKRQITIKDLDEYGIKYIKEAKDKPQEEEKPSEPPKEDSLELTDSITLPLHKSNLTAKQVTFTIEDGKLVAINNENQKKIEIFTDEPVYKIAGRPYCCTGDTRLIILTENKTPYITKTEIVYSYEFGNKIEMFKLSEQPIKEFKIVRQYEKDLVGTLVMIDEDGNRIYEKNKY